MKEKSNLGYLTNLFDDFEEYFQNKMIENESKHIIFLSIGNCSMRAYVYKKVSKNFSKSMHDIRSKAIELVFKKHLNPQWIKVDIVVNVKEILFEELEQKIANTKKNYFRYGIAFDSDFRLAFLEQEINANAMIRSVNNGPLRLDEKNINHYLNQYYKHRSPFIKRKYRNKYVYLFETVSVFKDIADENFYELYNGTLTNGIRKITNIEEETKRLIEKGVAFLVRQVKQNGQFEYGYFPAFAKKIQTYNILRHASTLYSMAEAYEVMKEQSILHAVEKGIEFLIQSAIVYKEDASEETAFVVDYANENEIKLGSNATALLAMTKYMEVTNSDKYLRIAQALARGIVQMKTSSGGFIHVVTYPSFDVKDLYRIIYYEGEAIFSLLRLYAIDKNKLWLDECKQSFKYFIEKDYWKHHDHWLSYAVNELTIYEPDEKYFIFGLKNCEGILDFIYQRETTYPTFLELTMAAYKMCKRMKALQKEHLFKFIDYEQLLKTIDKRAEYQRVGFFYPELAMYFKKPEEILHGFFIRHHSFRVRIDDVEHNLSGYIQYFLYRTPDVMRN